MQNGKIPSPSRIPRWRIQVPGFFSAINRMAKGSGHSFPLHSYALSRPYILIVPATGAFYDLQPGLRACVRRGRTSSEISGAPSYAPLPSCFTACFRTVLCPCFCCTCPSRPSPRRWDGWAACPWAQWLQADPACSAGPSAGPRQGKGAHRHQCFLKTADATVEIRYS